MVEIVRVGSCVSQQASACRVAACRGRGGRKEEGGGGAAARRRRSRERGRVEDGGVRCRLLQLPVVQRGRSCVEGRKSERERERERKHVGWCRVVSPVVAVYGAERRAGEAAEPERRKGAEKCSGG
jgi:hypothetical protein